MFTIDNAGSAIAAVGALGTAAYGLVDATKVFGGGVSRAGFGHVQQAVAPYIAFAGADAGAFGTEQIVETLRANWMNGMAKADQKAIARSLIRLMLKPDSAEAMARRAGVAPAQLKAAAEHVYGNQPLTGADTNALGAFDVAVSAALDLGYERGDQLYRNMAKIVAGVFAVGLTVVATVLVNGAATTLRQLVIAILVGVVATPLAPVAKDLASALQTAVKTVGGLRR
jgi:hypothetical protein